MPRIEIPEGKADPEVRMWALRPEMGMGAGALSHAIYEQSIVPCASASSPACASRRSTTARSASSGARPRAPPRR